MKTEGVIRLPSERLEGRNGKIWRAYLFGTTQEEIAERHGLSQPQVSDIINQARAAVPAEDAVKAKQEHLEVMRTLAQVAGDLVDMPLPPAYSNGRPVVDENGQYVRDLGPRLAALDRQVKINERVAKVLGLDAPVQADIRVSELENQVAEAAAAEAISRLMGPTTPE